MSEASYAIGGKDAMIAIGKAYVDYINKKDKKWVKKKLLNTLRL